MLLLPHMAFALQNRNNHGLHLVAPLRSLRPSASATICYALSDTRAILIIPVFVRSCSADGKRKNYLSRGTINNQKNRHWLVRVAQV